MGDLWLLPFVLNDPFILGAKVDGTKIVQKSNPKCGFRLMSNMLLKHHRIPSMSQRIKYVQTYHQKSPQESFKRRYAPLVSTSLIFFVSPLYYL